MGTLAELILKRDKERGGGIVLTMPTTNDAGTAQKRPAPSGKLSFWPSAALFLLDVSQRTHLRRHALHPAKKRASSVPIN